MHYLPIKGESYIDETDTYPATIRGSSYIDVTGTFPATIRGESYRVYTE